MDEQLRGSEEAGSLIDLHAAASLHDIKEEECRGGDGRSW